MRNLRMFDDVGEHAHRLLRNVNATNSSGGHMHVWLTKQELRVGDVKIPANGIVISSYDGGHEHGLSPDGLSTAGGGEHRHAVRLPGFRVEGTAKDGPHDHLVLVQKTGFGGPHTHELTVGGVTLTSLKVEDFLKIFAQLDAQENIEVPEAEIVLSFSDDLGCVHGTEAEKIACQTKHMLEKATGLKVYGGPEHTAKETSGTGINDRILGALDKLSQEI